MAIGLLLVTLLVPDTAPLLAVNASALPAVPKQSHHPLFIVGLDGVDWQILRAAVATGRLPHVNQLLEQGSTSSLDNEDYGLALHRPSGRASSLASLATIIRSTTL